MKPPKFTVEELKAIHHALFTAGWSGQTFYEPRRAIVKKLDEFFGEDQQHLKLSTR